VQFTREVNRLLIGLLFCFGIVTIAAAYWAISGADTLLLREDNPRRVEAEESMLRGDIAAWNGELLVTSSRSDLGIVTREYLHPEMHGALGYYSLRYGVSGVEEAFNPVLRGDDLERDLTTVLTNGLLHRPQEGSDVRLTLDVDIQRAVVEAMHGHKGAAVVLGVPGGEVLALISQPTYNPNTLDADWETLKTDPNNPFFNRAVQGSYQPGGTLQTPLMAAALLIGVPLDEEIEDATASVALNDLELTCAVRLPPTALTLREAYGFACPAPFAALVDQLGVPTVQAVFDTFRLEGAQPLFLASPVQQVTPSPAPTQTVLDDALSNALGQGSLNVSPLNMAMMAASIVNDGNAPQPYVLLQTRSPDSTEWTPVQAVRPTIPVTTVSAARRLQDLMRNAVANGAAQNAGRPNTDIGGHATLAYSGEGSQAWFIGFATLGGRQGVAVAVVLENSDDPGLAADIGGTALMAAQLALNADSTTP
jgi:peptidoglycan glycosyltransferase